MAINPFEVPGTQPVISTSERLLAAKAFNGLVDVAIGNRVDDGPTPHLHNSGDAHFQKFFPDQSRVDARVANDTEGDASIILTKWVVDPSNGFGIQRIAETRRYRRDPSGFVARVDSGNIPRNESPVGVGIDEVKVLAAFVREARAS